MTPKKYPRQARPGNRNASKGEPRKMWTGRLPLSTLDRLRALKASGAYASQADAIAAGVARLPTPPTT